jgi:hypothetical protein
MTISNFQPDKNAERVDGHKWAFTTARTISFGAQIGENTDPYFSRSDAKTLSKYSWQPAHHARIRRIVLSSQAIPSSRPPMIFSTVSAQCRLYGITMSGNSWCIFLQTLQRKRRMIKMMVSLSLPATLRFRQPKPTSFPPHTGQTLVSKLCM